MTDEKITALFPGSANIPVPVSQFLREWADAIDAGDLLATSAVLVTFHDRGAKFAVSHRRCNADIMRTVAMLETAKIDLLTTLTVD